MFNDATENQMTEQEIRELAKIGENIIVKLKALKKSGNMKPEEEELYNKMLLIYNET